MKFQMPFPVRAALSLLPQYPPALALVTALNLALGRVIPREPLEPLLGKRVCLRVTDAGLTLHFTLTPAGFKACHRGLAPDLTISANARDFLMLALRREDPDTLFFSRRLLMEGDTELGLLVKNTLDAVEFPDFSRLSPASVFDRVRARLLP